MNKRRNTSAKAAAKTSAKRTLRQLFRDWDEDRVDLTAALEWEPAPRASAHEDRPPMKLKSIRRLENFEIRSYRHL